LKSGSRLPQSKTTSVCPERLEIRASFWSAPVLWRFELEQIQKHHGREKAQKAQNPNSSAISAPFCGYSFICFALIGRRLTCGGLEQSYRIPHLTNSGFGRILAD